MNSRYPDNWKAIADQVKAEALGRCQRCGWGCDGSSRDRVLQVHHWDMMPENNLRSNLVALCPRCHLELHQGGRGNVSEGQMGLLGSTHETEKLYAKPVSSFPYESAQKVVKSGAIDDAFQKMLENRRAFSRDFPHDGTTIDVPIGGLSFVVDDDDEEGEGEERQWEQ